MNSLRGLVLIATLALAAAPASSQDQASTLAALTQRSDTIAVVRVLAVARDDRGETWVTLQSQNTFKGPDPARFSLHEPGARACGRALWGLVQGRRYLAFLDQGPSGPELTVSNARSLVALEPALIAHFQRLLAAKSANHRVAVLATGLASRSQRVREDSALALPLQAALTQADATTRSQIAAALLESLQTQDRRLFSLLQSATRLRIPTALPPMLNSYLQDRIAGMERALLAMLSNFPSQDLVTALQGAYQADRAPAKRILALLDQVPGHQARPLLLTMVGDTRQSIALEAGACLLRDGFDHTALVDLLGEERAQASRARIGPARPRFRTILHGGTADEVNRD